MTKKKRGNIITIYYAIHITKHASPLKKHVCMSEVSTQLFFEREEDPKIRGEGITQEVFCISIIWLSIRMHKAMND